MPGIDVTFAESALRDLEEIRAWYAEQGVPEVGDLLVAEVFQQVEHLVDHPDIGRMVPEFNQPFLRELIHPPFRIVYRRDPARLRVVRVWSRERLLRLSLDEQGQTDDK
jgi:plasmid stabilization system protein ParE